MLASSSSAGSLVSSGNFSDWCELAQLGFQQFGGRVVLVGLAAFQQQPDGGLAVGEAADQLLPHRGVDQPRDRIATQRSCPDGDLDAQMLRILHDEPGFAVLEPGQKLVGDGCERPLIAVGRFFQFADIERPQDDIGGVFVLHCSSGRRYLPLGVGQRAAVQQDHAIGIGPPALQGEAEDGHVAGVTR